MKKSTKIYNEGSFTRMCSSCGARRHKRDMFKITRHPNGEVYFDENQNGQGRGCYLCHDINCINIAVKSGRVSRTLKSEVSLDIYNLLIQKTEESNG